VDGSPPRLGAAARTARRAGRRAPPRTAAGSLTPMGPGVTRRTFLARSGVAAAALVAAGAGASGLLRGAARRPRLSPARRRTYVALVDAVGRASESQVDPSAAAAAAASLGADYTRGLEPTRAAIDDVLDRLEAAPAGPRPFSALDPPARLATLRGMASGTGTGADVAGRAVALAAAPFHPPASDFHPTPVSL
jgi:hypothetical protein